MEQQIRFCTTSDGVRIAYATVGEGSAAVCVAPWISHLELNWKDHNMRAYFEALARHHTLVRYDNHGCGLSDRNRTDLSLDAEVQTLEAVIDHLRMERFALLGASQAGPVAAAYAARHPGRVSHLILYGTYAHGGDIATDDFKASMLSLVHAHWGVGSKALADIFLPGADADALESFARLQRESATAEMAAQLLALTYEIDVADLLPKLVVPTVVIHRQSDRAMPFRLGREVAALLPNARLVPLEGRVHLPWLGDSDSVLRAIAEFLGDPVTEDAGRAPVTILFTDVEGSTALTQRLGDAKAREVLRTHEGIVRDALRAHRGTEVKTMGDGFMASFGSATKALECAIAMQRAFTDYNAQVGAQGLAPLRIRIGLNAGEPIAEEEDLFGTAVIVAARIAAKAQGGEILVANVVRELAAGKGFLFADRGDVELRGFEDPVRLYEVRWREA